jgi:predicted phage terminase large subunit-like protein
MMAKKLKGLEDLYFFNKYIIEANTERQKMIVPHVHGEWATWFKTTLARIKMILVPRGTFKSTFFTVGWSLQQIAKNKNKRILIANATLANSRRFLGEIQRHIKENELFKTLYGEMFDPRLKWNEDELVVSGRDLGIKESNVTAVGVGGNLVSQHYDIIIGDDLVNDENSATRYQADKVIDWWRRSLALLEPDGLYLLIGTRWSYYELYQNIIQNHPEIDKYIRGAYNPDGSFYFPERYNEDKLNELKKLHGSYIFSSFFLNDPVDEETALIKKSQILYWGDKEERQLPRNLAVFACCDPAISQEAHVDNSTIIVVGVDLDDNWYVLELRREKWTVGELIENLFATNKEWKPKTMSIEVVGMAQGLMDPIHREEEARQIYLPLVEIKARGQVTKETRMRAILQPRFERGKIFLRRGMFDLEEELLKFPKAAHDDAMDALTDISEIGFQPDKEDENVVKSGNYFENQLQESFSRKMKPYVDQTLGEFF